MKKTSLAFIGMAALLVQSASAQLLFTTYEDFLQWQSANGFTAAVVTSADSDGGNINGLGNTNAFGAAGTGGALAVQWPQGGIPYNYPVGTPGEQGFTNFIAVLKQPGKVLTFDYRAPTNVTGGTTGTYFNVGVTVNCQGLFDQLLPTSTASLGGGWTRASIDWSLEASNLVAQEVSNGGTFTYFQLLMIYNSDYNPTTPFYIDNFVMRDAPGNPAKMYTTTNDFTGWTSEAGFTNVVPTTTDLDGAVTNGVGNLTAAGAPGAAGSLQIQHVTGNFGVMSYGPYEQSNTAFVAALKNASVVTFNYTTPTQGTGTYFEAGIVVDCEGRFDQLFPSATATVSGSVIRASIDWATEAQALVNQFAANTNSFSYFRIGVIWNSDYDPGTTPFQVDNITAVTNSPFVYLIPASSNIFSEGCTSTNGAIDPGETVTVKFVLQNTGNNSLSNVVATLLASGGVTSPSGSQSYGTLSANGGAATNSFTFTANGTCGDPLIATLQIQTNSVFYRTIPYGFRLGTLGTAATNEYSSGGISVAVPDNDTNGATSSITVSETGSVSKVVVRLRINHTFDGDLRIDLVHPDGTIIGLIAPNPGNGGANFGSGATSCAGTLTVFDDAAATPIAAGAAPFTGSFKPRQALSALNGKSSQGIWTLKVTDTAPGDSGTIYCFQLQIAEQPFSCCSGSGPTDPFTTWQSQYFAGGGSNTNAAPGADPDFDGMSNTNEFLAGFNPTNNAARLKIINVAKSGTNIVVTYLGADGNSTTTPPMLSRTNVLEFTLGTGNGSYTSTNFTSTGQSNVLSGGTGLGTITSFVDTNGASGATKYYRVRVLVP